MITLLLGCAGATQSWAQTGSQSNTGTTPAAGQPEPTPPATQNTPPASPAQPSPQPSVAAPGTAEPAQQSASGTPKPEAPSNADANAPAPATPNPPPAAAASAEPQKPASETPKVAEPTKPAAPQPLRVLSWGGAYGEAEKLGVFDPIKGALPFSFASVTRADGEAPKADIVEVDQPTLFAGCKSGRFAKLEGLDLAPSPDGQPANEDFLPGAVSACGVGTFAWSALFLVDGTEFKRRTPKSIANIFDKRRYPGKRAFLTDVPQIITMAALASGISAKDVYETLKTQAGADKVFDLLETLREDIVWAENPADALDRLDKKEVSIAMSYSGRVFRRAIAGHLTPVWDGNVYEFASWAITANSTLKDEARVFIAAATAPERLADQAKLWPYGPMRRSSVELAKRHARIDVELAPHLPTTPEHLKEGVAFDAAFWAENGAYYTKRLEAFREGVKQGIRVPPPGRAPKHVENSTRQQPVTANGN